MDVAVDSDESVAKRRIVEFVLAASTEVSTHDEALLPVLASMLPRRTTVYVAHTPKADVDDVVRVAVKAQSLGMRASPHIVARRLVGERQLRVALSELRDAGVEQILLIAGDRTQAQGRFASTLDVLDSGAIADSGMARVGVAGHPEGHRHIGPSRLLEALKHKAAYAARTGVSMHIVTQFGFNPSALCAWAAQLARNGIALPVHAGIAGPTPLPQLIKFAMRCGIGASLGSLMMGVSAMSSLAHPAVGPDEVLTGVLRESGRHGATNVIAPHFYSFGGAVATARWLRAVIEGNFQTRAADDKFSIQG